MKSLRALLVARCVLGASAPDAFAQEAQGEPTLLDMIQVDDIQGDGTAIEASRYAQSREGRLEEVASLRRILSSADLSADTRSELTLRLAELLSIEAHALRDAELAQYEEARLACERSPECAPYTLRPDHSESRRWQQESVQLCEALLLRHPDYARADEVHYLLGVSYGALGEISGMLTHLKTVIKAYPDSSRAPEAYLLIGDHYFGSGNPAKARIAYNKVLGWPDHPLAPYAAFKLAWCDYNVGELRPAIDGMKRVIATSGGPGGETTALRNTALIDLVRFYADEGALEEAHSYYKSLGEEALFLDQLCQFANYALQDGPPTHPAIRYQRSLVGEPEAPTAGRFTCERAPKGP